MLVSLAWSSLGSRRKSVVLTFLSLLISISVLLSVEHIRQQAKESFNRTISDVDLIVGAPSGQLNLFCIQCSGWEAPPVTSTMQAMKHCRKVN